MLYVYSEVLVSYKKEWDLAICDIGRTSIMLVGSSPTSGFSAMSLLLPLPLLLLVFPLSLAVSLSNKF